MSRIRIGWSAASITPDRKIALAGQFYERVTEQVRDPVMAVALALEGEGADGGQAVLVGCDLVAVELVLLERVRELCKRSVPGLNPESIILCASHTHTGPLYAVTDRLPMFGQVIRDPDAMGFDEYVEFAASRIAGAVQEAWERRAPGGISHARGMAAIGFNRMVVYDDDTAAMYGNVYTSHFRRMIGPEDPRVEMLFTWDERGGLTGVLFNSACTAQIAENQNILTADFYGEVRKLVAERWSPSVYALGIVGAAGDLAPRDTLNQRHNERDYNKELRSVALQLFHALETGLAAAKENVETDTVFSHVCKPLDLPLRKPSKSEAEWAQQYWSEFEARMEKEDDPVAFFLSHSFEEQNRIFESHGIVQRMRVLQQTSVYPMELHVIRLGDIALATNPFELYTEYGLQIKARSAAKRTFIAQLSGNSGGYLPTASAVKLGGYSTYLYCGYVGPDAGEILVDRTVEEINRLWAET